MSESETVYRTTAARTGKMMVIMLGICIVGGAIFFGMWDLKICGKIYQERDINTYCM